MTESSEYDFSKYPKITSTLVFEGISLIVHRYGSTNMSGCIYLGNDEHTKFTNEVYGISSLLPTTAYCYSLRNVQLEQSTSHRYIPKCETIRSGSCKHDGSHDARRS